METIHNTKINSMPRIGDIAPNFEAVSTKGKIKLLDFVRDKWIVMFSYPADFTPVSTTEMSGFAVRKPEFDAINTKYVGRNMNEILRALEALQTSDKYKLAMLLDWKKGDNVIVSPPKTLDELNARIADDTLEKLDWYLDKKSIN